VYGYRNANSIESKDSSSSQYEEPRYPDLRRFWKEAGPSVLGEGFPRRASGEQRIALQRAHAFRTKFYWPLLIALFFLAKT